MPVDGELGGVALCFPCGDLLGQSLLVGDAAIEALPRQGREFDLRDVEPTAMLGGVVDLQLVRDPFRFGGLERFVQRGGGVGIEIVHDQDDALGVRVVHVHQVFHHVCPVHLRPPLGHLYMAAVAQGLAPQEQVRNAVALVLVVLPLDLAGFHGQRRPRIGKQLLGGFVQANVGSTRVIGPPIHVQDILHMPDERSVRLGWDHKAFLQPRLELFFFSMTRTVSCESRSAYCSSTMRPANSRKVQRGWPVGASLHARAISRASWSPSRRQGRWFFGWRWVSAASSPSSTYRLRTRHTVTSPTANASTIFLSVQPGPSAPWSAFSKIRACVSFRAGAFPAEISPWSCARSSWINRTICLFPMRPDCRPAHHKPVPRTQRRRTITSRTFTPSLTVH